MLYDILKKKDRFNMQSKTNHFYQASVLEIISKFSSDKQTGLSQQEAEKRFKEYGPNEFKERPAESILWIFIRQFQSPLIYLLFFAAFITFILEKRTDSAVIFSIIIINALVGAIQEGRAQNIIAKLKKFVVTETIVVRDGKRIVIPSQQLVVGDIIVLQEGNKIPADARIISSKNLAVDESILTGESQSVQKNSDPIYEKVPVYQQKNMLFKGTLISSGMGTAIVVATGVDSQVGKLNKIISEIDTQMPLKRDLAKISKTIIICATLACSIIFIVGLLSGLNWKDLFITVTALFVSIVPEGLPIVLTIVLASGAYRMAKKHVLVKKMQAIEALGRVSVIVTDKTGTLTRNEMMVVKVFADGRFFSLGGQGYFNAGSVTQNGKEIIGEEKTTLHAIAHASLMCHAEIQFFPETNLFKIKGEPTEAAIMVFAEKVGASQEKLLEQLTILEEIPFSSAIRYQAGFYKNNNRIDAYVSGSPEVVIERCGGIDEKSQKALDEFLSEGLRIIAVAYKELRENDPKDESSLYQMTFLGILGIQDSIRDGVKQSVQEAHDLGIHVAMLTGDHQATALYVAKKVGIYRDEDLVVNGPEFSEKTAAERVNEAMKTTVYSRFTPELKVDIVNSYHAQHKIVAMTGDGVNDAPSLAMADVGVAMGNIGTEVAKEAADVVLLDDSFQNIMAGIAEGQNVFASLRRVLIYFFATSTGEVLLIFSSLFMKLPLPLLAVQIIWLNLVTDAFLDLALSTEYIDNKSRKMLRRKKYKLADWSLLFKVFFLGTLMGTVTLFVFWWYNNGDIVYARTMVLLTMAMCQWFAAWSYRSEFSSLFALHPFANRWLFFVTVFVFFAQYMAIYTPFMNTYLSTTPLLPKEWLIAIAMSSTVLIAEEVRKYIMYNKKSFMVR
jgi:Ca2+-transporting ATPase